jgi:hypothetical protein
MLASGEWLPAGLAVAYVLVACLVMARRDSYAFALEWMESGSRLGVAFLAKQTAVLCAAPFAFAALLLVGRRASAAFCLGAVLVAGSGAALLQLTSAGWFGFYVFGLLSGHRIVHDMLLSFWTQDIFDYLSIMAALGIVAMVSPPARGSLAPWRMSLALLLMGGGMIALAYVARLNYGGYLNVLMPAYVAMALLAGLGVARLASWTSAADARRATGAWRVSWGLHAVLAMQLLLLVYQPLDLVPHRADRAAGARFVAEIAALPGEVWLPFHPDILLVAGKPLSAHAMAINEVFWTGTPTAAALAEQLRSDFARRRYAAIVDDEQILERPDVEAAMRSHYSAARQIGPTEPRVFQPVMGLATRPTQLLLPSD